MSLSFAHQWILALLPAVPLVLAAWVLGVRRGERLARGVSRMAAPAPPYIAASLLSLAAAFALFAAAQPRWGTRESRIPRTGADLVIVIDVSRSMEARDLPSGRLQAAKDTAAATIARLGGDRVGLVVFAGSARTRFPLTTDFAAAGQVISTLATGTVFVEGGTSAGLGLEEAVDLLADQSTGGRLILLLTDGDDLGGDAARAATTVRESGAELFIAGAGTTAGATIPVIDARTGSESQLKDAAGVPIVTSLDEPFLRSLASAAGGRYLGADLSLVPPAIEGRLRAIERAQFDLRPTSLPIERYRYFAIGALASLLLAAVAERFGRFAWRRGAALAVSAVLVSGCATPAHQANEAGRAALTDGDSAAAIEEFTIARARRPDDPNVALNLAAAYHAAERFDEAITAARRALSSTSPVTRSRAYSSIGHHQFAAGRLPEALEAFRRALLESPGDGARHDYEVVLRLLFPPTPPASPTPDPSPGSGPPGASETPTPTPGDQPGASPSAGSGSPAAGTPVTGTPGPATPAAGTPPPGGSGQPTTTPATAEDLQRALDEIDREVARRIEEAGETPSATEALDILNLLAERSRIAALRDALAGGVAPGDR